jgi:hypothetical chaperone protein
MKLGIDFGTTNSAVAFVDASGAPQTLELFDGERAQRTVIYADPEGNVSYGNLAHRNYVENDLLGRFLRSLKAFLPYDVPKTVLAGRAVDFDVVIARFLTYMMHRAEERVGEKVTEVTVGRPVRFHIDPVKNDLAVSRLGRALDSAGVPNWKLQLEPVAAAHFYEHGLTRERLVLVGDFGGGTSDFAILRAGPNRKGDRLDDILATTGVAKAGDVLDGRFLDIFLMEHFGRGAKFRPRYTNDWVPWEHQVLKQIQRLYYLHMLRSEHLRTGLDFVEKHISDIPAIRRVRRLIFDDLGFPMAWAVEAAKRELSDCGTAVFRFDEFRSEKLDFEQAVEIEAFREGCLEVTGEYQAAIAEALRLASLSPDDIDDVFLTGGTSQLPFIRGLFVDQFGAEKLRSADAFTSVCEGLALS